MVSKHGLYAGSLGSIPTAITTMTAAGGDAEHVSLKSLTCSTIPRCKIGTGKTQGGQVLGASPAWDVSCPSALITSR